MKMKLTICNWCNVMSTNRDVVIRALGIGSQRQIKILSGSGAMAKSMGFSNYFFDHGSVKMGIRTKCSHCTMSS